MFSSHHEAMKKPDWQVALGRFCAVFLNTFFFLYLVPKDFSYLLALLGIYFKRKKNLYSFQTVYALSYLKKKKRLFLN